VLQSGNSKLSIRRRSTVPAIAVTRNTLTHRTNLRINIAGAESSFRLIARRCARNGDKGSSTNRTPRIIPSAKSRKGQPARNPSRPMNCQPIRNQTLCVTERCNRLHGYRSNEKSNSAETVNYLSAVPTRQTSFAV
jgi:hypothetical protein